MPVYDYVLVSEPLTGEQLASVGWRNRQGLGDSANQFHYYRLTADDRILWGGYDAIYNFGNRVAPELEQRERRVHVPRRAATGDHKAQTIRRHRRRPVPAHAGLRTTASTSCAHTGLGGRRLQLVHGHQHVARL